MILSLDISMYLVWSYISQKRSQSIWYLLKDISLVIRNHLQDIVWWSINSCKEIEINSIYLLEIMNQIILVSRNKKSSSDCDSLGSSGGYPNFDSRKWKSVEQTFAETTEDITQHHDCRRLFEKSMFPPFLRLSFPPFPNEGQRYLHSR